MSLHHIAKHLESQGRGPDTMLVHMAPNEVHAMNEFAKAHGTHLTVNPKTGLPEAGLLSMLIGGATAIFAPALLPYVAGGIGLANYMNTGSLGQGLMQGLSAWGGGNLAESIQSLAQTGSQNIGTAMSDAATKSVENVPTGEVGMFNQFPNAVSGGTGLDVGLGKIPMEGGQVGMANSFPSTMGGSGPVAQSGFFNNANSFGLPSTQQMGQNFDKFTAGSKELMSHPIDSLKTMWDRPGGPATLIGAGMNIASAFQPDPYKAPEEEENPFHLKKLSPDFKGSFPQPGPYYQTQYRNYVTNPYSTTESAGGGLQSTHYAKGDFVKAGLSLLNKQPEKAPIHVYDENASVYGPSSNVVEYEKEYEGMSPIERTHAKMQSLFGKKSTIKPVGTLGAISYDPAMVAQQSIEAERAKTQSSKEGGLMSYALGGLSVGHLGGYSDGGRLLKGPGDGVSDSIPASIGHKQPARLAEGEFVVPARIVSELGNGSTDAGAKRLYAMMDRIKARRKKTKDIAADSKAYNLLPA